MDTEQVRTQLADMAIAPRVQEIVEGIGDADLRAKVDAIVRLALAALVEIDRLHLPQDNFEDGGAGAQYQMYQELAPYVLGAVASMNRLLAYLFENFSLPENHDSQSAADDFDFDLEFDLVDGPTGDGAGLSSKATDTVMTEAEQAADAALAFAGMLRSRVIGFGDRLRHALGQEETWPLLAELDEFKHRLKKSVQGVLFGVLAVFAGDARREEILPEYRSAAADAVALRSALAELNHHIGRFNEALAQADASNLVPLVVGISDQLTHFAAAAAYHLLRAEDKKAVIDFRSELHALRHNKKGPPLGPLRRSVEGFSKFLESMQAINHREVLVLHDRRRLMEAAGEFAEMVGAGDLPDGAARLAAIQERLWAVHGRSPELDAALRDAAAGAGAMGAEAVGPTAVRWLAIVQNTLTMVG